MSSETMEILKKKQFADETLYDHFNTVLDEKIKAFGTQKMAQEVSMLREVTENTQQNCQISESTSKNQDPRFNWFTNKVIKYLLRFDFLFQSLKGFKLK